MWKRPDTPAILAPPPLLFFLCLLAGWGLGYVRPLRLPLGFTAGLAAGMILSLLGAGLGAAALWTLRQHQTPVEPWKPTRRMVTAGPYRFTRNPIYLALLLVLAALAAFTASGWILLAVPALFLLLDLGVVRAEETYLAGKFPEEYAGYRRSVRRWL
ncbi:MAG TPA: isoprenylcysteine carboxylmethyltransferase family protein [Holophagaceae bacterium]|nr:isoprenylcysteine carboxylmethyltransferase family protein [Holophagaceae bacterium]